jgi:hypothetical protein
MARLLQGRLLNKSNFQVLSIGEVEKLIGIKAHNIRVWEERYSLISPSRKPGNQRTYSLDDLKFLVRISFLYRQGSKSSSLAGYTIEELDKLIMESWVKNDSYLIYILQLLDSALELDEMKFEKITNAAFEQFGFERTVYNILLPLLSKKGLLRLACHVIPAQEQLVSQYILRKISFAVENIKRIEFQNELYVVLFPPDKEFHSLYVLMMHYHLGKEGFKSTFFGHDTTIQSINEYCNKHKVTHIYSHLPDHFSDPEEFAARLSSMFRKQQIVLSGMATGDIHRRLLNVHLIQGKLYVQGFLDYLRKISPNR